MAVLIQNVLQRWVFVAHRRLALEKAKEERKARLAAAEATSDDAEDVGRKDDGYPTASDNPSEFALQEPEVDLEEVRRQTRHLLGSLVGTCVILGLWLIWADVLPALSFLEQVRLWEYEIAATGEVSWITMKHVALATVIGVITIVAGRNLPGALELSLLQNLPIDAGARYAVRTLCQYLIVLVGIGLAFQAIGVGWAKIQWLVAAMGVGLGFGLQEIFANFVSGVILLFERPIRVGDIVTIGDVSGTVARIRMRATTIVDWERKELVVPNKTFITGQLLNWTLSDQVTRITLEVGVAYGTDTELARSLLLDAAREHPLILAEPAPRATFDRFGDSALNLTLRCFTSTVEARLDTIHELHTDVDRKLRAAAIEIAFPQRGLAPEEHRRADPEVRAGRREARLRTEERELGSIPAAAAVAHGTRPPPARAAVRKTSPFPLDVVSSFGRRNDVPSRACASIPSSPRGLGWPIAAQRSFDIRVGPRGFLPAPTSAGRKYGPAGTWFAASILSSARNEEVSPVSPRAARSRIRPWPSPKERALGRSSHDPRVAPESEGRRATQTLALR